MPRRKPGRLPVFLSALVYPGAGQFALGRWVPGCLFAGSFTALFVLFVVAVVRVLKAYYALGFDFYSAGVEPVPLADMLLAFGAALAVYLANVVDAAWSTIRARSKAAESELAETLKGSD